MQQSLRRLEFFRNFKFRDLLLLSDNSTSGVTHIKIADVITSRVRGELANVAPARKTSARVYLVSITAFNPILTVPVSSLQPECGVAYSYEYVS